MAELEAYCVKCKAKSMMKSPEVGRTARGGYMAKGPCTTCETKMAKILSKDQAEKMM